MLFMFGSMHSWDTSMENINRLVYLNNFKQVEFHHVLGKDILKFHHIHLPFIMKQLDLEYNATYSIHHHWVVEGVYNYCIIR